MLIHYFKIAIRSIWKDRVFSCINIVGLAVAMACSLLLIFWIKNELSYETSYPYADRIYRLIEVEERENGKSYNTYIRPSIRQNLKDKMPQVEAAAIVRNEMDLSFFADENSENDPIQCNYANVSRDFLKMFAFEYIEGSPRSIVDDHSAIITEETAKKFFGSGSAIGKSLSFSNVIKCTVVAVVKAPQNTYLKFDILSVSEELENMGGVHYVMLKDNTVLTPELENKFTSFLSTLRDTKNTLQLQPIKDIHLHSPEKLGKGNLNQIYVLSFAAFLILVVAVASFVNGSIARSLSRLKEVGVRKALGSEKRELIQRFVIEYFVLSSIAVLLSMILVQLSFSSFSEIMGNRITLDTDWATFPIALLMCIVITILTGGYTAFYVSSFNPMLAFKGGGAMGSKERLKKILFGVQFFLSVGILTCTVFIYTQVDMMMNKDIGISKDNVLVMRTGLWYESQTFIDVIKKENPNVKDASIASDAPYNATWNFSGVSWEGSKDDVKQMEFGQIFCDHNYANTFGMEMVQGEFIPAGLAWWQFADDKSTNIVINESFKKLMGEENPIGITVTYAMGLKGKVIGVVKSFNFKPLREKVTPLILSFNPEASNQLYIKTTGKDKQATLEYILKKYDEMKPDWKGEVKYNWVEDDFNKMYEVELRTVKILLVFAIISLTLSLMGIFSMVALMIEKRTKELAIRKINGASMLDLVKLFVADVLKVAAIASAVAIPVCYLIVSSWLQNYVYRVSISLWIFLGVSLFVIGLTAVLVGIQVCILGRQNPIDSLRNE